MKEYAKASLRIQGDFDIDTISQRVGMSPTHSHRRGEIGPINTVYENDMWIVTSPLARSSSLDEHLRWLAKTLTGRADILLELKDVAKIDIFCSITAPEQSGFTLSPQALSLFSELEVNMEVSLILSTNDGEANDVKEF